MNQAIGLLSKKKIIVTGGSRGIGLAVVRECLKEGADVAYLSRTKSSEHSELETLGGNVQWIETDVSSEPSIDQSMDNAVSFLGTIDVLVNNAGITRDGLLFRMKTDQWEDPIRTNLTSAFLTCRKAARIMIKAKTGSIVNITSIVGIVGNGGQTNYAASKAGLIGFTKSLAKELASRGVRVNAVAPGFIDTDMTRKLNDDIKESLRVQIPLGTLGKPEDPARAVVFLASDMASYITGHVLVVDGGMAM